MTSTSLREICSLEDWMQNPLKGTEWVDGALIHKNPEIWVDGHLVANNGMTLKHGRVQARLATHWENYKEQSKLGGEVYTEAPCRTNKQGRKPDVAYLTPSLAAQFGNAETLPQSFPLTAEVISPTDFAEAVIAKAYEYLQSGGEEVWLIFPNNFWVIVVTQETRKIFVSGEVVCTQIVLPGFRISVDELLA
ncbi:Uma2 family endonuclease [Phormidesmis priestleyi]